MSTVDFLPIAMTIFVQWPRVVSCFYPYGHFALEVSSTKRYLHAAKVVSDARYFVISATICIYVDQDRIKLVKVLIWCDIKSILIDSRRIFWIWLIICGAGLNLLLLLMRVYMYAFIGVYICRSRVLKFYQLMKTSVSKLT